MMYFTRRLYEAACVFADGDDPRWHDEGTAQWDAAVDEYSKHIGRIRPLLPESMQQFCEKDLHELSIESYSQDANHIRIRMEGGLPFGGHHGPLELVFKGVKSVQGIENAVGDYCLYEEVHLSNRARFEYHILLAGAEVVIAADDFEFIQL